MKRRDFMKSGLFAAGAVSAAAAILPRWMQAEDVQALGGPPQSVRRGDMLYRQLGSTGLEVSAIGLGGHHIGRPPEKEGIALVRSAIDRGLTFMDNCWDYHDGGSEKTMGKALKDGYRDKVILMTKIDGRTKKAAAEQIEQSLSRLQTDHIDLLQHHEVIRMEDVDQIFWEGGAMQSSTAPVKWRCAANSNSIKPAKNSTAPPGIPIGSATRSRKPKRAVKSPFS